MFNKNVFTQTDVVADLIKDINEADYKAKMEALKGNQHKIDKNKNNKIDAHDFKLLRGEKKVNEEEQVEEDTSVKIPTATGTRVLGHRYGNAAKTHRDSMADPFAVVKGPGQKDIENLEKKKTKKEEIDPNVTTTDTLTGRVAGKSANPFLKAKVKLNVNEEDLDEANKESEKDFQDRQKRLAAAGAETAKDPARLKRMSGIPGYTAAIDLAKKTTKEEVEELDELSKSTLGSYAKKASRDAVITRKIGADFENQAKKARSPGMKAASDEISQKYKSKSWKRRDGLDKAVDRLTKEEVEMNERELSSGETAEKERIVKGMKKSLSGFKARYGKDAKSVMYATATKAAKKD
jgi:hypothetical protein